MRDKEGREKMIYNKNVEITVIFKCEEDADEVMAVYQTHPYVQKYDLAKEWKKTVLSNGNTSLNYSKNNMVWSDHYDDVKALLYMKELIEEFTLERNFVCSCIFLISSESETYRGYKY
jgi:hypothetical protein